MKNKTILGVATLILLCVLVLFVIFSDNHSAKKIKNAISVSLNEDFKIKESLGKVFFVEQEEDSVSASTSVTVTAFCSPSSTGTIQREVDSGQPMIKILCDKYSSIVATQDGVIESVSDNRITLRHYDGKLSEYKNVGSIVKKGEKVNMGDSIGYAKATVEYKLYKNLIPLDPTEYIQ